MEDSMATDTMMKAGKTEGRKTKSVARHIPTAARALMGLIFFASGIFGLLTALGIVPPPSAPMPAEAAAFAGALAKTGYMMPLTSGIDLVVGALLLSNRFVPLALALIAPVIVNIVAFHAFLAPSGIGIAVVVAALEIYLAWAYRKAYRPMLAPRAATDAA